MARSGDGKKRRKNRGKRNGEILGGEEDGKEGERMAERKEGR